MPDIFDEVEEDLRAERARALGRRYAGLGIALAVLILAGTGGYVAWQQNHTASVNALADRFITAQKQADRAASSLGKVDMEAAAPPQAAFADIAATGPAGYRVLARLRLAALQWQTGQHEKAIATWQAISDDAGAPTLLRDLATVTSAQHQVDGGEPVLLRQRLEALSGDENPWAPLANETLALLDIRTGRVREAAAILQRLAKSPKAPQDMREMAGDVLTTLPADALAPNALAPPASSKTPPPAAPAPAAHG